MENPKNLKVVDHIVISEDTIHSLPKISLFVYLLKDNLDADVMFVLNYEPFSATFIYKMNGEFECVNFSTLDFAKPFTKQDEFEKDLIIRLLSPKFKEIAQEHINDAHKSNIIL